MGLSPIDALSAILLFIIFGETNEAKENQQALIQKEHEIERIKQELIASGKWTEELASAHQAIYHDIVYKMFQPWFSKNTFVAGVCGAVASISLGYTSVPGVLIGFCFASPRICNYLIRIFSALCRSK